MPNYFGEQRFGRRQNNDLLGAALLREDNEGVLKLLLGAPDPTTDDPASFKARSAFDARDNAASMHAWPRRSGIERRVLARLMKTHRPSAAIRAVDEKLRRLWISALQSRAFNAIVAERIDQLDKIMTGDLAYKHENGACFTVEDAAVEQPRADAFEISATGPLVGYRMSMPSGQPLEIEQRALAELQLTPEDFRKSGKHRIKGARRPLRVQPKDIELSGGVDEHGGYITAAFTLPAGSYATVLMRELMKTPENNDSGQEISNPESEQIQDVAESSDTELN